MTKVPHCILLSILVLAATTALVATGPAEAETFPTVIQLPDGWLPEGIETGRGTELFAGSRRHGGIYVVDLRTGEGRVLFEGVAGRVAVGLAYDTRSNYVFAAGGPNGDLHVYDADTGDHIAAFQLSVGPGGTFVNDAVATADAVYLTDSMRPVIYRLPLGPAGELPGPAGVQVLPLSGDYEHVAGQFNANGIEATPSGDALIIVQSVTGLLFRVDPVTGVASEIDLGGETVINGDGILIQGRILYVLQNFQEIVAKVELSPGLSEGEVVDEIDLTEPPELFDTPTTLALFGDTLYAVNARFTAGMGLNVEYTVVAIEP